MKRNPVRSPSREVLRLPTENKWGFPSVPVPPSGITYFLKATFGVADQALATGTWGSAEGVETGSIEAVINDGAFDIVNNDIVVTGQSTAAVDDLIIQDATAKPRTFGLCLKMVFKTGANRFYRIGFSDVVGDQWSKYPQIYCVSTNMNVANSSNSELIDQNAAREIVIACGGYNSSGVPFQQGDTVANFLYGFRAWMKGTTRHPTWTLVAVDYRFNHASLYAGCTFWNSNIDGIDSFTVPNSFTVPESMFDPEHLSLFTGANGTALTAYIPDIGNVWSGGDFEIQSNSAECSTINGVTNIGHDTFPYTADGKIEYEFTMPASGTAPFGFSYRGSDTSNFWYIRITPGGGTNLEIVEMNGGVPIMRSASAETLSASTKYKILLTFVGTNNMRVDINAVLQLSYTTTNTFNSVAILCGLIDTAVSNGVINHFSAWGRVDADYDTQLDSIV